MFTLPSDSIDPWYAAQRRACYAGEFALRDLQRLRPLLTEASGTVTFQLEFGVDDDGRLVVHGHTQAVLALCCQRCLEIMEVPVNATMSLALVQGVDEATRLPERYEPYLIEERSLRLSQIIEDELLLAVPVIPAHLPGLCAPPAWADASVPCLPSESFQRGVSGPFAALAAWKSHPER